MSDRETLVALVEEFVKRSDAVTHGHTYTNRVTFETTGETYGIPAELLQKFADTNARLLGSGGNKYRAHIPKQE